MSNGCTNTITSER